MAINPGNAAPGTLNTVLNSMVDQTSSPAQRGIKKKKKPDFNSPADKKEDRAAGIKPGSPADMREDRADAAKWRK